MVTWQDLVGTQDRCGSVAGCSSLFVSGLWIYSFRSALHPPNPIYGYGVLTVDTGNPDYDADAFTVSTGDVISVITNKVNFTTSPFEKITLNLIFTTTELYNNEITPTLLPDGNYLWEFVIPGDNYLLLEIESGFRDSADSYNIINIESSAGCISGSMLSPQLMEAALSPPF